MSTLRPRLIGAWRLESYLAHPTTPTSPTSAPIHPMSERATGLLLYTPDGHMSAHLLNPGQAPFAADHRSPSASSAATPDGAAPAQAQWAEAARRYTGYAGPFTITQEEGKGEVLRHRMEVAFVPGMVGTTTVRLWRFEEGDQVLVLAPEGPVEVQGQMRRLELRWRRTGGGGG